MASRTIDREIEALVSMMDEPDPDIYRDIAGKIRHYGRDAIPFLEQQLGHMADENMRRRVELLVREIHHETLLHGLASYAESNEQDDLLNAWLLVTKYHYPDVQIENIIREMDSLRKDVWLEMNDNLTALEQVKVFNHVFYRVHGFKGNIEDYHHPDNSFVNRVLKTREGNPLSIGIIYMLVARRVNLPIMGVNLPEHFVLAYVGETIDTETLLMRDDKPLFYINAFSDGALFSGKEINEFLKKLGLDPMPAFFEPCSNKDIILRMLNNLMTAYEHKGELARKAEIETLRDSLEQMV